MRVVRYFFVGGAAATVDLGIFFVFAKLLGFQYLWVSAIGFMIATMVNYLLSVRHVFTSGIRFSCKQEILWVYTISTVGLALNQAILFTLVDGRHAELILSKFTANGCVFFWNYLARRHFVFRDG
jgi:putative flippase GtrA